MISVFQISLQEGAESLQRRRFIRPVAYQFHLFAFEVSVGGDVVETALDALYGNSVFHISLYYIYL